MYWQGHVALAVVVTLAEANEEEVATAAAAARPVMRPEEAALASCGMRQTWQPYGSSDLV